MLVYIHFFNFYYLVLQKEKHRYMNFLMQHDYISKLLILKADAQHSKATQARLKIHKTIIKTQNKIVFTQILFFCFQKHFMIQEIIIY